MSLLRFAGRVLFSSYFIADGYQLLTKPDQHADEIGPTMDRLVPAVQSFLPPDAADRLPEDTRTWTRILGIAQIVGGAAYATGLGRRTGAWLLTASTLPRVINASGNRDDLGGLLSKVALLGAGVVATQDTNGRPGLAWRAEQSRRAIEQRVQSTSKDAERMQKAVGRSAKKAQAAVERNLKEAQAQAVALSEQAGQTATRAARKAAKKARKQAKKARRTVEGVLN